MVGLRCVSFFMVISVLVFDAVLIMIMMIMIVIIIIIIM